MAVLFILPQFGLVDADSRSQWVFTGILVSGLILYALSLEPLHIVALTNKRLLIAPMPRKGDGESSPWFLGLYSNDVTKIDRVDTRGGRIIRLELNPKRPPKVAHLRSVALCDLSSQVDEAANRLEKYRSSGVVCSPEDRDEQTKTDIKELVRFSGKSVADQHSPKEMLLLAGFFVLIFGFTLKQYYSSQSWPSTNAGATYSEIKVAEPAISLIHGKLPNSLFCIDRYLTYKVKGVEYKQTEESVLCFDTREAATAAKKPDTTKVIYDPEKPSECTTDRKGDLIKASVTLFLAAAMLATAAELTVFKPKNNASKIVMTWVLGALNVIIGLGLYGVFATFF